MLAVLVGGMLGSAGAYLAIRTFYWLQAKRRFRNCRFCKVGW